MPLRSTFTRFFAMEAASGLLLIAAAILALIINNSPLSWLYNGLLETPVVAQIGALKIAKPLLLWINDGLMALFFLLIGLEVKREVLEGQLSKPSQIVLPGMAAIGGMLVPALIYWATRLWLKTGRGEMDEDPVVFTARDPVSLGVVGACGVAIWLAM